MKIHPADKITNLVLLGHGGSGKTVFAEAVLYNAKAIDRMGKSNDGNLVMDFDPEEIRRQVSLNTSVASCDWQGHRINLIDTPGDFDFVGEVMQGIQVADAGLVMISAKDGMSVGAAKAIKLCKDKQLPYAFMINRMDEANANYEKALASLQEAVGHSVVPLTLPIIEQGQMTGLVDILAGQAYAVDAAAGTRKAIDLPADLKEQMEGYSESLHELVAETDEELMEKYFSGEPFTADEISQGIHTAIMDGSFHPVLVGAGLANWAITQSVDLLIRYFPNAAAKAPTLAKTDTGEDLELPLTTDGPLAAFVFKTIADPFVGRISMFKVYSGVLKANSTVYNPSQEKEERVSAVFSMIGKKQKSVDEVGAGDIGAVTKLLLTVTNDTLCERSNIITLPQVKFPVPCLSLGIVPVVKGEEDKIMAGLNRLKDEDPVFDVFNNPETRQLVISGLGEQQLDVLRSKLKLKYNVEAELEEARVPYRETIRKKVRVQGRHRKQTGGHGQYGDVWIEFEPGTEEGLTFEEKIFGGSVPKSYHPAVEKGLQEAIVEGPLAGYPVVNLKAVLVDGSYHDVDSSEMAFKIAARLAYRTGLPQAAPVLLEPISTVEIHIPDDYLGDIMGDLNKRRGRIMGINPSDDEQVVQAEVPTAEMGKYASDLKSMTQGRGWYTIEFARYEQAPQVVADKVIADAKARQEDEQ